jgi:uncharacterized membrane protein YadS
MNGAALSMKKISSSYLGIALVAILAYIATVLANTPFIKSTGMSPVVLGVIVGMIFGNTLPVPILDRLKPGTAFAAKY